MSAAPQNQPHAGSRVTQPGIFFWCVKREIWENRFIFIAPAAVGLLVVAAYLVGTADLPEIMRSNPGMQKNAMPLTGLPFTIAEASVVVTGLIAGVFYALGALYNERRDRSILFWKSLPISDRTVVLSKAAIAFLVLPAVTLAVTLVMQLAMLGLGAAFGAGQASGVPSFWKDWPFLQMAVVLAYCFATMLLWQAPLWGWLFAVSAWAKRAPFLWAFLLPLALTVAQTMAFSSSSLGATIIDRIAGGMNVGFTSLAAVPGPIALDQIAPGKFLAAPGLWIGLVVAAGFFWAAIRLRRRRGPL